MAHKRFLQGDSQPTTPGITIGRPRAYELVTEIGLAGRRRRVFSRLVELAGARPGERVLEVGCGTGYFARMVAEAVAPGGSVVGIDPSPPVIQYAQTHRAASNCSFEIGIAEALAAKDESVDVIISSFMVHHLPGELRPTAVQEMHRVLRPGGRLLIADFRPPRSRLGRRIVGALTDPAMQHNPIHQLEELVRDAGFASPTAGDLRPFTRYVAATKPTATA